MPLGEYLAGLVFAFGTLGACLVAASLLMRRHFRHLSGAPAVLGFAVLACTLLVAVHLLPGLVGILSRGTALAASLLVLAAAALIGGRPGPAVPRLRLPAVGPAGAAGLVGATLAGAYCATWAWLGTGQPTADTDTMTFVLPNLLAWMQSGSVWDVHQYTPLLANGNYPHNGDLLFLGTILPFDSDAYIRAAGLPFAAVAGVAVYALARELRATRSGSALMAATVVALPVFQISAFEGAKADVPALAMMGAGLVFLARQLREYRTSELLLAGLALGFAFGSKWWAVWSVAVVVVVWAAVALWRAPDRRAIALRVAGVGGLIALAGGIWLLRNLIESGSPVYPSPVRLAGLTIFDAPRDFVRECGGYTILGYVDDPRVIRELIYPAWRAGYAGPGLVLLVGWLAATVFLVRDVRGRVQDGLRPVIVFLAVSAPLLALVYMAAPYSAIGAEYQPFAEANLRWLMGAALPAAALTAWALTRLPRVRPVAEVVIVVALFDALRTTLELPADRILVPALGLAAATATVAGLVWLWRRHSGRARAAALAGAALLGALVVWAGYERQRHYADDRYATTDPVVRALARTGDGDRRVGLAGVWGAGVLSPVLPAAGPGLNGHVEFVGPTVDGQLREYDTRERFLRAVRRGRYDLLVVGRNGYGSGCPVPGEETDDDRWAREGGLRLVARTPNLSLYRVPGG
ncbi:MAG TPA: glycosyltransferase family 39 protein [Thermoleophilaceae bacterium]|nr:glycosyltransferase family 39 protein [Thermoleophilaceae bacterium]